MAHPLLYYSILVTQSPFIRGNEPQEETRLGYRTPYHGNPGITRPNLPVER
jgi:hypothetical protein